MSTREIRTVLKDTLVAEETLYNYCVYLLGEIFPEDKDYINIEIELWHEDLSIYLDPTFITIDEMIDRIKKRKKEENIIDKMSELRSKLEMQDEASSCT